MQSACAATACCSSSARANAGAAIVSPAPVDEPISATVGVIVVSPESFALSAWSGGWGYCASVVPRRASEVLVPAHERDRLTSR